MAYPEKGKRGFERIHGSTRFCSNCRTGRTSLLIGLLPGADALGLVTKLQTDEREKHA